MWWWMPISARLWLREKPSAWFVQHSFHAVDLGVFDATSVSPECWKERHAQSSPAQVAAELEGGRGQAVDFNYYAKLTVLADFIFWCGNSIPSQQR
jgi:hypothetical protein